MLKICVRGFKLLVVNSVLILSRSQFHSLHYTIGNYHPLRIETVLRVFQWFSNHHHHRRRRHHHNSNSNNFNKKHIFHFDFLTSMHNSNNCNPMQMSPKLNERREEEKKCSALAHVLIKPIIDSIRCSAFECLICFVRIAVAAVVHFMGNENQTQFQWNWKLGHSIEF